MKIKRILGLILFAFIGVLALASCNSKGNFQTDIFGKTYSGNLYKNHLSANDYYLISDSMIYSVRYVDYRETKYLSFEETKYEKIDDNTWQDGSRFMMLVNNGQELMYVSRDYGSIVYTKTDHIE